MSHAACRRLVLLLAAVAAFPFVRPASVKAWGFDAHYFILERALDLMPAPTKPFFDKYRRFIVNHTIDPDLWRNVGFDAEESPRHFIDLDTYGAFPFETLPREYGAAVQKFGPEHVTRYGVLPWRVAEMYGRLVRAFDDVKRERWSGLDAVKLYTAVLAHYVADGHMPLHASANHDGQLTKQNGIHARWESELFQRYRDKLTVKPSAAAPVKDPREAMFRILLDSHQLVEPLLAADRKVVAGRERYDEGYFDAYFAEMKPMMEKRLGDSIANIAAFVTGAWEAAGRPALPPETKRTVRKTPSRTAR